MDIQITQEQSISVVTVSGKLDALTAPEYEQSLNRLIHAGVERMILDFSGLSFISSAGLRALLNTNKPLQERQGRIVYAALQEPVREVFDMTGLLSLFEVADSVEQAFDVF